VTHCREKPDACSVEPKSRLETGLAKSWLCCFFALSHELGLEKGSSDHDRRSGRYLISHTLSSAAVDTIVTIIVGKN
jgi:hypothetical protein